jgi:hypothetical protein
VVWALRQLLDVLLLCGHVLLLLLLLLLEPYYWKLLM